LVSCCAHVFVLFQVVIVTPPQADAGSPALAADGRVHFTVNYCSNSAATPCNNGCFS